MRNTGRSFRLDPDQGHVLRAEDTVIDRGAKHAWENRGSEPVMMASITIDAPTEG